MSPPISSNKYPKTSKNDQLDERNDDLEYEPPTGSSKAQDARSKSTTNRSPRIMTTKSSSNSSETPTLTQKGNKRRPDHQSSTGIFLHNQSRQDWQELFGKRVSPLERKAQASTTNKMKQAVFNSRIRPIVKRKKPKRSTKRRLLTTTSKHSTPPTPSSRFLGDSSGPNEPTGEDVQSPNSDQQPIITKSEQLSAGKMKEILNLQHTTNGQMRDQQTSTSIHNTHQS